MAHIFLPLVICIHCRNLWLIPILLIYDMLFFNTFKDIKFLNQVHKNADFWQNLKMADIFRTQSDYLWHCYQQTYELVFCINHYLHAHWQYSKFPGYFLTLLTTKLRGFFSEAVGWSCEMLGLWLFFFQTENR